MSENKGQEYLEAETAELDLGTRLQQVAADAIPNLVSGAMRTEMLRLQAMEEHYTRLREEFKKMEISYKELSADFKCQEARFENLDAREDKMYTDEADLGLRQLEYHIKNASLELREDHALVRVADHKEMFNGMVRNTTFRNNVMGSSSRTVNQFQDGYTDEQGVWHNSQNSSNTHSSTDSKDETRTED